MTRAVQQSEGTEELEARLGYTFSQRAWLDQALTHRSLRAADEPRLAATDNERLEFLGDAVLGFLVSDALYKLYPGLSEGKLSRIRSNLVNRRSLGRLARRLELGRYLRLGPGEEKTGGRQKQAILANAVEALVAAIYRDGGVEAARHFLDEFLLRDLRENGPESLTRSDYKSAVQEYLQARRQPPARYLLAAAQGPDHQKMFTVELWVGQECLARGEGASKKAAEQQAARRALSHLRDQSETDLSE